MQLTIRSFGRSALSAAACTVSALFAAGASAAPIIYTATLTGPAESPPNASPGTGTATLTFDAVAHT